MSNVKKITSLASIAAILASVAALPVSAAQFNRYTLSYEVLTEAVVTENDNIIPAGAVAVTTSLARNTGFDSNTLKLNVEDGYTVLTDADNKPIIQKGEIVSGSLVAGAISEDGSAICVAFAGKECTVDGTLFTYYVLPDENNSTTDFVSIVSASQKVVSADVVSANKPGQVATPNVEFDPVENVIKYLGGDANNDNVIDASDASTILAGLELEPSRVLSVDKIAVNYKFTYYFPSAFFAMQPDADGNDIIAESDAQVILDYCVADGVGGVYDGYAKDTVGQWLPGMYL